MLMYAVDDEPLALRLLETAVSEALPQGTLRCFSRPEDLIAEARKIPCDVAFLDVRMYQTSGIEVARQLNEFRGARNIVFVTGYDSYAKDAFDVFASGYVTKPVCSEDVAKQLKNLRNPMPEAGLPIAEVRAIGYFDVFVGGEPVSFKRSKSKELLAYLVLLRGARVSTERLEKVLWSDEPGHSDRRSYVSVLISDLRKDLAKAGAEAMMRQTKGGLSVDPSAFRCDLYDAIDGNLSVSQNLDKVMIQYPWAPASVGDMPGFAK